MNNAQIAAESTPTLGPGTFLGSQGSEFYAQTFAYQAYAIHLTYPDGYFVTTADGLFHKKFFSCVQTIAAQRAGTIFVPLYSCP
jgi:hypothetical protein